MPGLRALIMIFKWEMERDMNWLLQMTVPVLAGFVLDLLLGDPAWLYHPVRLIGLLIEKGEKNYQKMSAKDQRR